MKKGRWKVYAFWIGLSESVGLLAGFLTRQGTEIYNLTATKPPLSPPGWVFPVVWTILYGLMGYSAWRIWQTDPGLHRSRALNLMIAQLIVNFFWPLLFFNAQAYGLSFFWLLLLWGLVLWMILAFAKVDKTAAWLQVPYLIWLTFALYLNAGVWYLN